MADHDLSPPKSWNSNENILSVHPREVVMPRAVGGRPGQQQVNINNNNNKNRLDLLSAFLH